MKSRSKKQRSPAAEIKNIFRPFFNISGQLPAGHPRGPNRTYWQQIQRARAETPVEHIRLLYETVEGKVYYPFPGLGPRFPVAAAAFADVKLRKLSPLGLGREITLQVERVNFYSADVVAALQSLSEINQNMSLGNFEHSLHLIEIHKEKFGISIPIIKKEFFCTLQIGLLKGLLHRLNSLTESLGGRAFTVIARYCFDIIDPTNDPIRSCRYWSQLATQRLEDGDWYARLIRADLFNVPLSQPDLASTLLRMNGTSPLDLALLIWRIQSLELNWQDVGKAWKALDHKIVNVLEDKFRTIKLEVPKPYLDQAGDLSAAEIYRFSFVMDEISSVTEWRSEVNKLLYNDIFQMPRSAGSVLNSGKLRLLLEKKAEDFDLALCELSSRAVEVPFLSEGSTPRDLSFFSALLIADALGDLADDEKISPDSLIRLLCRSTEVYTFVPYKTLDRLANSEAASRSALLRFFIADTKFRKRRTSEDELDRRACYMDIIDNKDPTGIVKHLNATFEKDSRAAILLARILTRRFLERLFLIMSSLQDVLQTRLEVCQWLLERDTTSLQDYKEECEALARELENLDTRSDLDSTRVHVDEDSLQEWFVDNQQASATRYMQAVLAEGDQKKSESFIPHYSRLKDADDTLASASIGSDLIMLHIADATLKSFARDKSFGLDSYLSRRIRHGTLRGHLIPPVDRAIRRFEDTETAHEWGAPPGFQEARETLMKWKKFFTLEVDRVRRDFIQLRSEEHPEGIILATWRTMPNLAHLDAMLVRVRQRILDSAGVYDLFPDIHAFCWDCLEPDLNQLRFFMTRVFLRGVVDELRKSWDELSYDAQQCATNAFYEITGALDSRVKDVCGWFIRPVFRRDSYDLLTLVKTITSATRELDEGYKFEEEINTPAGINVSRASFEVFADILFVLVGNAARHGKAEGRIKVSATRDESNSKLILLSVISELRDAEHLAHASRRIQNATGSLNHQQLADAAVREGFSGLGKLQLLVARLADAGAYFVVGVDENQLTVSTIVALPAEITPRRIRRA